MEFTRVKNRWEPSSLCQINPASLIPPISLSIDEIGFPTSAGAPANLLAQSFICKVYLTSLIAHRTVPAINKEED